MEQSSILVRGEGGLGDCLLANRFIPAIREYHPDSEITFALDNDRGESFQLDVLSYFYPEISDNYSFFSDHEPSHFDYFYDLHIDKMLWTQYSFDWLSRFYYFPKPKIEIEKEDFVCLHLTHDKWPPKNLSKYYIARLIEEIRKVHPFIKAICTESEKESYEDILNEDEVVCSDIITACKTVAASKAFITIDSGFKYIAYAYGVPTIETADYYKEIGKVHPMIKARWLPFNERGLPLMYNVEFFKAALYNILNNKISTISPFFNTNENIFKIP
tara:strand:+ start:6656 stop:7474 length:819 start_codon:yes stop_codon:yes gene_type:complete